MRSSGYRFLVSGETSRLGISYEPHDIRPPQNNVKVAWPPPALGLGPAFNLVSLSRELRRKLGKSLLLSAILGFAGAITIAAVDQVFFDGETARGTPALDQHPAPAARVAITFVGGLVEELFFRVFFAVVIAALVWLVARRILGEGRSVVNAAQWIGTISAAIYVGVWHVGMVGDPVETSRVVAINAIGNVIYGWTFWRRGLESSVMAHGVLNGTLYLGLPLLH